MTNLLFQVPFFLLVTLIPFNQFYKDIFQTYGVQSIGKNDKIIYRIFGLSMGQTLRLPYRACILATIYLTLRESFQLFFVSGSIKDYFKKKTNQFEIILIVLSWALLWAYLKLTLAEIKYYTAIPSAFLIIIGKILNFLTSTL